MKKYRFLFLFLLLIGAGSLQAQQAPLMAHFNRNPFVYNPAYLGTIQYSRINAIYRQQWAGFEGAPNTFMMTFQTKFSEEKNKPHLDSLRALEKPYKQTMDSLLIADEDFRDRIKAKKKEQKDLTADDSLRVEELEDEIAELQGESDKLFLLYDEAEKKYKKVHGELKGARIKGNLKKFNIGGTVYKDDIFLLSRTGAELAVGRAFPLGLNGKNGTLSVGLSLGAMYNTVDMNAVVGDKSDPRLVAAQNAAFGSGSLGIVYQKEGFSLGYSVQELFFRGGKWGLSNGLLKVFNNSVISASYHIPGQKKYGVEELAFTPQIVYRFANAFPGQLEASVMGEWRERAWLSVGYRTGYGLVAGAGFKLSPNFGFGYVHELGTGETSALSAGTHEIMLSYSFGVPAWITPPDDPEDEEPKIPANDNPVPEDTPEEVNATAPPFRGIDVVKDALWTLNKVGFDRGTSEMTEISFDELDELAEYLLKAANVRVEIGCHTDSLSSEASRTLTQNRAEVISEYLQDKGIESGRLAPVGYGRTRPLDPTRPNERRNDRVEIKVIDVEQD